MQGYLDSQEYIKTAIEYKDPFNQRGPTRSTVYDWQDVTDSLIGIRNLLSHYWHQQATMLGHLVACDKASYLCINQVVADKSLDALIK